MTTCEISYQVSKFKFHNDIHLIKYLIDSSNIRGHTDITEIIKYSNTVLLTAAYNNNVEIIEYLINNIHSDINYVVDINYKDECNFTPLMIAAVSGSFKALKCLVDNGAKLNFKNIMGNTALMLAINSFLQYNNVNYLKCLKFLIISGAHISLQQNYKLKSFYQKCCIHIQASLIDRDLLHIKNTLYTIEKYFPKEIVHIISLYACVHINDEENKFENDFINITIVNSKPNILFRIKNKLKKIIKF